MTAYEQMCRELLTERFGKPTPPPPPRNPISHTAIAELLAELAHLDDEEGAA